MLASDYSWQLGDAGIVLNPDEITADPPSVDITEVRGMDSAPIRETARDHEGADGGFLDAVWEKGRPISLEGLAYAAPELLMPFLDELKYNWAPSRTLVPLYMRYPGMADRVLFVKPRGCRYDLDAGVRIGRVPVQFLAFAEDPRIYSSELVDVEVVQSGVTVAGMGFPHDLPYGFGDVVDPETVNLVNQGNRPTPVKFIVNGPVVTPDIVNETTGQTLRVNITLDVGEYLEIDTQYHTVLLNGSVNRRGLLEEPNWFFLQKGDNFIRLRAATAGSATMAAQYRHAWR
jgi:hypothetical protein